MKNTRENVAVWRSIILLFKLANEELGIYCSSIVIQWDYFFDSTIKWVQCIKHSPVYYILYHHFTSQMYFLIYSEIWVQTEVDQIAFVTAGHLLFQLILSLVTLLIKIMFMCN